jgi:hypothetical protein
MVLIKYTYTSAEYGVGMGAGGGYDETGYAVADSLEAMAKQHGWFWSKARDLEVFEISPQLISDAQATIRSIHAKLEQELALKKIARQRRELDEEESSLLKE